MASQTLYEACDELRSALRDLGKAIMEETFIGKVLDAINRFLKDEKS